MFRSKVAVMIAAPPGTGFQSLFSWMFRSKIAQDCVLRTLGMFQSLFSWMFRSKLFPILLPHGIPGFNPCSRGCFVRSTGTRSAPSWLHDVSILVLVDVSFEVRVTVSLWVRRIVSILVLVDVSFEGHTGRSYPPFDMFQSLFSWMFRSKSALQM